MIAVWFLWLICLVGVLPGCGDQTQFESRPKEASPVSKGASPLLSDKPPGMSPAVAASSAAEQKGDSSISTGASDTPDCLVREQIVPLKGGAMRMLVAGASDVPPVLIFPGATYDANLFVKLGLVDFLCQMGMRAVSVDQPGHGKSGRPDLAPAQLVRQLMTAIGSPGHRPVLMAHSWGGHYVLPALVDFPELIGGAILSAPVEVPDYAPKLKGSGVPVLVLWGEKDRDIPPFRASQLVSRFENGHLEMLKDAPHESYLTDMGGVERAIRTFLTKGQKKGYF